MSDEPRECPSCGIDITAMDLAAFRDHTKAEHPEMHALILSALKRIAGDTGG